MEISRLSRLDRDAFSVRGLTWIEIPSSVEVTGEPGFEVFVLPVSLTFAAD
jgi:hypothetical protein